MHTRTVAFLLVCLVPAIVFGWGAGHDQVNELAVKMLHGILPAESATNVVRWSHAPDDFTRWEKLTQFQVPLEDLQLLKAHKLKTPYSSHTAKGQAVEFILLINAFKENAPQRIAFWSACLLHTLADEAACNHDPLIHYATYAYKSAYRLKMGPGVGLDFADVARTPEGKQLVHRLAAEVAECPLPSDPDEAVLEVMLSGVKSNAFMTRRGTAIAASFARNATAEQLATARTALAELGVHGAARGHDVIVAAKEFAQRGVTPELTPALEAEFQKRKAAYVAARPLSDDSLFADLLKTQASGDRPAVGVLVEPSVSMNEAHFSFGAKVISAGAARSMQLAGVPIRLIDVRCLENEGTLSPQATPVLFVCAGPLRLGRPAKDALAKYFNAGGRPLWIGGEHGGLLGELSASLVPMAPEVLPVATRYGQDTPVAHEARFHFLREFQEALGSQPYCFVHNPNTKAGWQVPRCRYQIKPAAEIIALAEMRLAGNAVPVVGAWMDLQGKAKAIFIPEYLLAPYVLSEEDGLQDLSRPALDRVGRHILSTSLRLLGQPVVVSE